MIFSITLDTIIIIKLKIIEKPTKKIVSFLSYVVLHSHYTIKIKNKDFSNMVTLVRPLPSNREELGQFVFWFSNYF